MLTQFATVHGLLNEIEEKLGSERPELVKMFKQCYPNTLETTTEQLRDGTTFVFTGDIPAMWLRDSTAQVKPYIPLAARDPELQQMLRGLIQRQVQYLLIDPYANAFNKEPNGQGHQNDRTEMSPWIWERKFELDSLCYPVQLVKAYLDATGDITIFDTKLQKALWRVIEVMRIEQHHDLQSPYTFERDDCYLPSDTLPFQGKGTRTNYTGMVWSGFRPSDDACKFGYLIPANMFAAVILGHIVELARDFYEDADLVEVAIRLRQEIEFGIHTYGIVKHPRFGRIYAYETDGYGNYNLMDDANVPSLLSIPYFGYRPSGDQLYRNTRAFVLSEENPYYYRGKYARGIGSPHTPPGYIWHIGLLIQALTSNDRTEQDELVEMLVSTTAGTGFMHESFDPNRPEDYTRPWFAWANSLFGEFIYRWAM